jgi:carboxylesterase
VPASIIPGAEPWSAEGGPHGVLVLHGFTGSPQSMRPLAEAIAGAGYTVDLPLLPGHGTAIEDMVPTRWDDWRDAAERSYLSLSERCQRVVVSGLSMGGTLSCALAAVHPEIAGIAVVNPMIDPPNEEFRGAVRSLLESGTDVAPGIGSDIAKEGSSESAYEGAPLESALSFFEGVDDLFPLLGEIRCPVLLFSSRQDHVVEPSSGDVLASSVSGRIDRVFLERSYHVATLDWDAPIIEDGIVSFCGEVMGGPGKAST